MAFGVFGPSIMTSTGGGPTTMNPCSPADEAQGWRERKHFTARGEGVCKQSPSLTHGLGQNHSVRLRNRSRPVRLAPTVPTCVCVESEGRGWGGGCTAGVSIARQQQFWCPPAVYKLKTFFHLLIFKLKPTTSFFEMVRRVWGVTRPNFSLGHVYWRIPLSPFTKEVRGHARTKAVNRIFSRPSTRMSFLKNQTNNSNNQHLCTV